MKKNSSKRMQAITILIFYVTVKVRATTNPVLEVCIIVCPTTKAQVSIHPTTKVQAIITLRYS